MGYFTSIKYRMSSCGLRQDFQTHAAEVFVKLSPLWGWLIFYAQVLSLVNLLIHVYRSSSSSAKWELSDSAAFWSRNPRGLRLTLAPAGELMMYNFTIEEIPSDSCVKYPALPDFRGQFRMSAWCLWLSFFWSHLQPPFLRWRKIWPPL